MYKQENISSSNQFRIKNVQEGITEAYFSDKRHTWQYEIYTTAKNDEIALNAACVDLLLRFGQPFESPKPGTVEVILIRHGQHTGEKDNRIEGWAYFNLTDHGKEQAAILAQKLKNSFKIHALYSSSLTRAKETADIIGHEIGLNATEIDDLRAMNYGLAQGLTKR
ncbi:histidine phosphatase family protein [Bacillus sp. HMF5848]|uniref:histidine phosphatase family protein n=1 Tax=Bacillus sp. HMF5848 TaxID=2495421 RepID=UPI000F78628A|nr:histidine phosphatase family protein [Bacillus sp. HMF5848]RSK26563.1 histidine phosphatase family protein [Bacillus sp. HMF5848]